MSTQAISSPFINGRPPEWASGYGQDEFGYFAEFSVPKGSQYWEFLTQRMRWIPPGTFLMGAAPGEPTFVDSETRREITLTRGFWLADTACTQQLWTTVNGDNPSRFQGDDWSVDRPVERVSFDDVERFIEKLNHAVPEAGFRLPTEAQWEYACRAGTTTPFSFGESITTEQVNFNGNHPYGNSTKGIYRKETVDVKELPTNDWGLYQMHGNVWEWCLDWYAPYSSDERIDPVGPEEGSRRVVRGGSWFNVARLVRSACRYWLSPGDRGNDLGFRLLSSAGPVKEAERESGSRT